MSPVLARVCNLLALLESATAQSRIASSHRLAQHAV